MSGPSPCPLDDSFDRFWQHLAIVAARQTPLRTFSGRSSYRLSVAPDGLTLKSLQGFSNRRFSRANLRQLWGLRRELGDPAAGLRPADLERRWGTGRHGSYLWLVYGEMWEWSASRNRGKR